MRKPLYRYPLRQAAANDEVKAWRESHRENIRCRDAMDISIRHHFDGMHLDDCAEELCDEFGADRVAWILASTIQHADWDGRYRPNNREWAAKYAIPTDPEDKTSDFCLTTHPEIVNGFANQYRQYFAEHGIHGNEAVIKDSHYGSYENKLLVLNPSVLAEEYRDGDYQYFFARSGFGCDPSKLGTSVYGEFLIDGEHTHFARGDFLGVADEEQLPEWAKERLAEITSPEENQNEGMGEIQ